MKKMYFFHAFNISDVVFILSINAEVPIIVGILTFISMINFMLSRSEHLSWPVFVV